MNTGYDIIAQAQLECGETRSTLPQLQAQMWPRHLIQAANEIAQRHKVRYMQARHDVVQGRWEYTIPYAPFKLCAVTVTDNNGNTWPCAMLTPADMDDLYWLWRSNGGNFTGIPSFYVVEGTQNFLLYWTPNFTSQNGLNIEGFWDCSDWQLDQPSPIGPQYDFAIRRRAQLMRCQELITDQNYQLRVAGFQRDFDSEMGRLYGNRIRHNPRSRVGGPGSRGKQLSVWSFGGGNTGWSY